MRSRGSFHTVPYTTKVRHCLIGKWFRLSVVDAAWKSGGERTPSTVSPVSLLGQLYETSESLVLEYLDTKDDAIGLLHPVLRNESPAHSFHCHSKKSRCHHER